MHNQNSRLLGLTREVARSVNVVVFEVEVGLLLAAEERGGGERARHFSPRRCRPPGHEGTAHVLLCCVCCVLLLLLVVWRGDAVR